MLKQKNTPEETVQLAGETWVRLPGTLDGLRNEGFTKFAREDTLRRAIQARDAEAKRTEVFLRDAEQAHQRLLAQPVEYIGDVAYRTHPDEPDLVVAVVSGTAIGRRRVEEITGERTLQAARDQRRNELHAAVSPGPLAARLAELEAQLAQTRTSK